MDAIFWVQAEFRTKFSLNQWGGKDFATFMSSFRHCWTVMHVSKTQKHDRVHRVLVTHTATNKSSIWAIQMILHCVRIMAPILILTNNDFSYLKVFSIPKHQPPYALGVCACILYYIIYSWIYCWLPVAIWKTPQTKTEQSGDVERRGRGGGLEKERKSEIYGYRIKLYKIREHFNKQANTY